MSNTATRDGSPASADILVRHRYIITMDDEHRLFADGAIAIAAGKIIAVGDDADNDEEEYLSVLLSAIEMGRNGTTCFLEAGTVLTPHSAARAAAFVGIWAILGDPFIWDQPQGFAQGKLDDAEACKACASHGRVHQELKRAPKT